MMPALLGNHHDIGRKYVFAEHPADGILTGTEQMTMNRSESWKLVHYVDSDEGELYHLAEDPNEKNNVWHQPAYQEQKQIMLDELLKWFIRTHDISASYLENIMVSPPVSTVKSMLLCNYSFSSP